MRSRKRGRLVARGGDPPVGQRTPRRSSRLPKRSRSSARSTASKGVPRIRNPAASIARASFSGVWPPNWMTTPSGCSRSQTASTDGGVERLEVEAVGRVVVGRNRLRVAVDHHRLVAERPERLHGVHAAVVELDALADPVRARAENDDAAPALGRRLPRRALPRWRSSSSTPPRPRRRRSRCGGRPGRAAACFASSASELLELAHEEGCRSLGPPVEVAFEPALRLHERLDERAADPIVSPTDFICVPSVGRRRGTSRMRSAGS